MASRSAAAIDKRRRSCPNARREAFQFAIGKSQIRNLSPFIDIICSRFILSAPMPPVHPGGRDSVLMLTEQHRLRVSTCRLSSRQLAGRWQRGEGGLSTDTAYNRCCSSVVERVLGKDEVKGSSPFSSFWDCGFRIADFGLKWSVLASRMNPKSEIRNPKS